MTLSDVRDYVASLNLAGRVYQGKVDDKFQESIGVYNSKHQHAYKAPVGGKQMASYGLKYVTLLVHWNKSQSESEDAAMKLFEALEDTREATINNKTIKFVQLLYEPQDIGTDEKGIYEWVIEVAFVFAKGE